jgi:predicted ArsR family transcriptional regulator
VKKVSGYSPPASRRSKSSALDSLLSLLPDLSPKQPNEVTAEEVAKLKGISTSTARLHLAALEKAGKLTSRECKDGRIKVRVWKVA